MTTNDELFIDIGYCQRQKHGENICGDAFAFTRVAEESRIIAVLSDGLGSGVKANILATMTAAMALKFTAHNKDIIQSADIMMGALPICEKRKISYATFTIVDTSLSGRTKVIEMGNPPFILARQGKVVQARSERQASPNWKDREIDIYSFDIQPQDRLIFFSDGVSQAGMGTDRYKLGWRVAGCQEFVEEQLELEPEIGSSRLSDYVVKAALQKEPNLRRKDDMTCAVIYYRHPKRLLLLTGPAFEADKDAECARMLDAFPGRKVVCGGTTATIIARELGRQLQMDLSSASRDLPPVSSMPGVDLVTEGIFTLTRTTEYLEKDVVPTQNDAAARLVDFLKTNDIIEFVVGTRINEAHQDPNLPEGLEIRRNIIRRLAKVLRVKYLKETVVKYV